MPVYIFFALPIACILCSHAFFVNKRANLVANLCLQTSWLAYLIAVIVDAAPTFVADSVGRGAFCFRLNPLGVLFALVISLLWPFLYLYSSQYIHRLLQQKRGLFLFFLNASVCLALLLTLADNLTTMYVFYELLTLATIPLVAFGYDPAADKALGQYILYLMGTSAVLLLPAIVILGQGGIGQFARHTQASEFAGIAFVMMFFGFAKAAPFPLHSWLLTAMRAPYPTSALLHAVVVVKMGLFCMARVAYDLFEPGLLASIVPLRWCVMGLVAIGAAYLGVMSTRQSNIKTTLAYSTLSYLNLLCVGIISFEPWIFCVALQKAVLHAIAKCAIFLSFGILYMDCEVTDFRQLDGIRAPFGAVIFCLVAAFLKTLTPVLGIGNLHSCFEVDCLFEYLTIVIASCSFLIVCKIIYFAVCLSQHNLQVRDTIFTLFTYKSMYNCLTLPKTASMLCAVLFIVTVEYVVVPPCLSIVQYMIKYFYL